MVLNAGRQGFVLTNIQLSLFIPGMGDNIKQRTRTGAKDRICRRGCPDRTSLPPAKNRRFFELWASNHSPRMFCLEVFTNLVTRHF